MAGPQSQFEWIEIALQIAAVFGKNDRTRSGSGRKHCGAQKSPRTVGIVEQHIEGIVGGEPGAFDADIRSDGFGYPQQRERLIDEVRREVEEDAATGGRLLAPRAGLGRGTIAIVSRFETSDAAEFAGINDFP